MVLETEWGVWRNCCEVRASYLSLVSNLELQLGFTPRTLNPQDENFSHKELRAMAAFPTQSPTRVKQSCGGLEEGKEDRKKKRAGSKFSDLN